MSDPGSDARFGHLFRLIGDPVVEIELVDDTPVVVTVNPAFEEVFGYQSEEIRGESLNDFIVPPESTDEAARFDRRTAEGKYNSGAVTRMTATGPRDFLYRGVPYERDGDEYGFAIYTDITERNRRRQELERKNEQLEEFTHILSHDLRNPLSVAQGRIETIDHDQSDVIEENLDRIESIIDDVLTLAWGGETITETESVMLSSVAQRAWEHVETRDGALSMNRDCRVQADPARLQQLLENLFRNCIEHGGSGVTATVGRLDDPSGFYVADDGPGVPSDERDVIFEQGYSTKGETRIGLSIVRTIADAHGWELSVTESLDGGAQFEVVGVDR